MAELFKSGRLIDVILVIVAIEVAALLIYWHDRVTRFPTRASAIFCGDMG